MIIGHTKPCFIALQFVVRGCLLSSYSRQFSYGISIGHNFGEKLSKIVLINYYCYLIERKNRKIPMVLDIEN